MFRFTRARILHVSQAQNQTPVRVSYQSYQVCMAFVIFWWESSRNEFLRSKVYLLVVVGQHLLFLLMIQVPDGALGTFSSFADRQITLIWWNCNEVYPLTVLRARQKGLPTILTVFRVVDYYIVTSCVKQTFALVNNEQTVPNLPIASKNEPRRQSNAWQW